MTVNTWALTLFFLSLQIIPAIGMSLMGNSSTALGLILMLTPLVFSSLLIKGVYSIYFLKYILFGIIFILLQIGILEVIGFELDLTKLFGSLAYAGIMIIAASTFYQLLSKISDKKIDIAMTTTFYSLIIIGILAIIGVPSIGNNVYHELPIIFFMEPSHYALSIVPFFYYCFYNSRIKVLVLGLMLFMALAIKNLTILFSIFFIIIIFLNKKNIYLLLLISPLFFMDNEYFYSRININEFEENLSLLAFLQGYERAYLNSIDTFFIGNGFQQFGLYGKLGDLQDIIYLRVGNYLNLTDGATIAAKIIGEFGLFGILILAFYGISFFKSLQYLRHNSSRSDKKSILYRIFIVSMFIELFIRNLGYFSPMVFLAIVGLIGLKNTSNEYPRVSKKVTTGVVGG